MVALKSTTPTCVPIYVPKLLCEHWSLVDCLSGRLFRAITVHICNYQHFMDWLIMFTILFQSCSKRKRSAGARQLTGPDDKVFSTSKMIHIIPGANSATTNLGIFTNFLYFHIHLHSISLGRFRYYTQKIHLFYGVAAAS